MTRRPDRIPPYGRRATIIRAAREADRSLSEIVKRVRGMGALRTLDPTIDRLKTRAAVQDLRSLGLLKRTPHGYRATPAGLDLLRASEGILLLPAQSDRSVG